MSIAAALAADGPCPPGWEEIDDGDPWHEAPVTAVLTVPGEEILSEFVTVMQEWGHYRTASSLRFPTLDEARAAVCRQSGRIAGHADC